MKGEIKFIVALAQKSRHIVETCWMKQRRISPAERDHVWMSALAVKKGELLVMYVISIAQVTGRRGFVSAGHCFNLLGVGMKSEACHAAKNLTRKAKKHESGKDIW